jgi:hypothetical protein
MSFFTNQTGLDMVPALHKVAIHPPKEVERHPQVVWSTTAPAQEQPSPVLTVVGANFRQVLYAPLARGAHRTGPWMVDLAG